MSPSPCYINFIYVKYTPYFYYKCKKLNYVNIFAPVKKRFNNAPCLVFFNHLGLFGSLCAFFEG